jgi:site-specific recombinase XerD
MGLRVSEIVNLKIADIDSKRMLVHIEAAKGKIDR